ncbi:dihydrodipicolinate reductase [Fructobacillus pseudoficulneus]|uniref:4-hydroxy-tetrahydrodipicolinate reductase n=1 Tax=Fructobacillus pseudoficulneus TaxID=220714 RepID=A0A3F3H8H2_9LACO|nr:4-hydroxy-tetrahydrodipicolinate reductase [Fructobacillus pseudoficulneus]GAP02653.1 dihydrodipicolinate reductase [Fructobacillus pseudoficulneus]SEH38819.1 dihydrodipicolinate reductase [Fructobacillus pseudoficulneus]
MKTIFLAGAHGKMGLAIQDMIEKQADFSLVGMLTTHRSLAAIEDGHGLAGLAAIFTTLESINTKADVWVDVTKPHVAFANGKYALTHGYDLVMGTSGLKETEVDQLRQLAEEQGQSALIVPNFSITAVLLMKYAAEAAAYLPAAEIIEAHHEDKVDAPSGTAVATAALIAEARQSLPDIPASDALARGDQSQGVPIHAMRLPGILAEETVIFGSTGETLTIKQSTNNRSAFMTGVREAIKNVDKITGLAVGLDKVL